MPDQEPNQGDEPRLFTLTEAERTLREIEPLLVEAVECRRKLGEAEEQLGQITSRILMMGGILVDTELTSRLRSDRERCAGSIREALEGIEATGCIVKDLDTGLLDFPARIDGQEVICAGGWVKIAYASGTVRMKDSPGAGRWTPATRNRVIR